MKTLLIFGLLCFATAAFSLPNEKLFCSSCGRQNELTFTYCLQCGTKLDKSSLVGRLRARAEAADSMGQEIRLTRDELSVLVEAEVLEKMDRLRNLQTAGRIGPKTETEKVMDFVAPIMTIAAALYLMSKALF